MQSIVLEGKNLVKTYELGDTVVNALDGVSIQIQQGEFVSIMGPSGSGKTTLLDTLSCLLRPTRGELFVNQQPVSEMDDSTLAQVRGKTIGFVFQTFNLIPRKTAMENVMLPLWFNGIPRNERARIASDMLKEVGLGDRLHHKPTQMSGGQRQRVAIARALAVNPDVIVADEPTGNLDTISGNQVLELIDDLHQKKKKTILMVTHETDIAERAERVIHLRDGKIERVQTTNRKKTARS